MRVEKDGGRGRGGLKHGGGEHLIKNEGCGPLVDDVGPANVRERVEFICQRGTSNGGPRCPRKNCPETELSRRVVETR